jgi:hypothetical protein
MLNTLELLESILIEAFSAAQEKGGNHDQSVQRDPMYIQSDRR